MNPDEDVYLSAYLDGELPPEPRLRVDSALLEHAALADRLRDLSAVHDLVAGLPRPAAGADLAGPVLAELHRRRSVFSRFAYFEKAPVARGLALFSAAAALVACATVGLSLAARHLNGPVTTFRWHGTIAPRPAADPAGPERVADSDGHDTEVSPRDEARRLAPGPADRQAEWDALVARRLLDDASPRRAFVVENKGGDAPGWVLHHLQTTPRWSDRFVQFRPAPGTLHAPGLPAEAVVFAARMSAPEVRDLRASLAARFGRQVPEVDLAAEVVTMLADSELTANLAGTPVANLFRPVETKALLLDPRHRAQTKAAIHPAAGVTGPVTPPPGAADPDPAAEVPAVGPAPGAAEERAESVVLIWVKASSAAGP